MSLQAHFGTLGSQAVQAVQARRRVCGPTDSCRLLVALATAVLRAAPRPSDTWTDAFARGVTQGVGTDTPLGRLESRAVLLVGLTAAQDVPQDSSLASCAAEALYHVARNPEWGLTGASLLQAGARAPGQLLTAAYSLAMGADDEEAASRILDALAREAARCLPTDSAAASGSAAQEAASLLAGEATGLLEDGASTCEVGPGGIAAIAGPASERAFAAARRLGGVLRHAPQLCVVARLPDLTLHCLQRAADAGPAANARMWLDGAVACCPRPGVGEVCSTLLERHGKSPGAAGQDALPRLGKGDAVWYWLPQGDWAPAQV